VNNLNRRDIEATAIQSAVTAKPHISSSSGKSTVHSRLPSHEFSNTQTNLLYKLLLIDLIFMAYAKLIYII